MERRYIRARSLTGLREVARDHEGDLAAVFREVGLELGLLRRPDEQIEFEKYCKLLEHCAERWRLPDLGFRMAPHQHLEILGPVALVTRMERTLRDALDAITRNLVLYTNMLVAALEERDGVGAIVLGDRAAATPIRQYMFLSLAVTRNVVEQSLGRPVRFIEASFRESVKGGARTAEAWFGCPVRFGVDRNALYFDGALLDTELERCDTAYHSIVRRYLSTERSMVGESITDAVRGEVARRMELGDCTLEGVAHALQMEPRGLQRRMKSEGASFRDLIDDWRRDRAMQLVTMTWMPLSDVADSLGYAHQAAFTRAFLRWYDRAPLACRQHAKRPEAEG